MANPEHLEALKQGMETWNKFRSVHFDTLFDFSGADLSGMNLVGAHFNRVNLSGANLSNAYLRNADISDADLSGANLTGADLSQAYMFGVNLSGANLEGTIFEGVNAESEILKLISRATANPEHLKLIKQGADKWNIWRQENPRVTPILSNADLHELTDLTGIKLSGAIMHGVNLSGCNLESAEFNNANLSEANLAGASLRNASLTAANLSKANLHGANLRGVSLIQADLSEADLSDTNLDVIPDRDGDMQAFLSYATFRATNLSGASMRKASLRYANLVDANLTGANLTEADLYNADLIRSNLTHATLTGSDLTLADLVETNLTNAEISGCRIYGASAWNVTLENTSQKDMVISRKDEPIVTVDDLEVGQFIYLMLNNTKIRDVINTITSKGVLILGRFADPQRKAVLDGLREKLREFDLLPIVFDFDRPTDKDYTETVQTLAGMSMFVIADVTNPKSTPLELEATAKQFKIPFIPIIDISVDPRPFAMLVDLQKSFHWVLPTLQYQTKEDLLDDENLKTYIIDRAIAKREELRTAKSQEPEMLLIRKKGATTPPAS
ncbi:MAG: pentapeptide repeat-containing protein [Anaerolineales bacterium]